MLLAGRPPQFVRSGQRWCTTVLRASLACLLLPVLGVTAFAGTAQAAGEITGQASPSVALGGDIFDTATLSGAAGFPGTISFWLFGPNDTNCSNGAVFSTTEPVPGAGSYPSASFTPTAAGTYRWIANWVDNAGETSYITSCSAATQEVEVTGLATQISSTASPSLALGGQVSDSASVSGGSNPTGTITFDLYGPDDASCSEPAVFNNTNAMSDGDASSGPFTPTAVGTYRWIASYNGDANNLPAAGACNDTNESVTVTSPDPELSMTMTNTPLPSSRPAPAGNFVFHVAVSNTGPEDLRLVSLIDDVYGDLDGRDDCAIGGRIAAAATYSCSFTGPFSGAPGASQTSTITADAILWSSCLPIQPGGVCLLAPAGATASDAATVTLTDAQPTLETQATGSVPAGFGISDSATLDSAYQPTGTITFNLYGPGDATCAGPAVASSQRSVDGEGTYQADYVMAALPGTYRWIVSYSGDANNLPVHGICNDPGESVEITTSIAITNSPDSQTRLAPGGTFTFTASVTNSSDTDFELLTLVDDVYGDLDGQGTCAVPVTVVAGGSYSCTFEGDFIGRAGDSQTNTITVTAQPTGIGLFALAPVGNASAAAANTLTLTGLPAAARATAGVLASTGSDIDRLGLLGMSLMVVGGLTLVAGRRRRGHRTTRGLPCS